MLSLNAKALASHKAVQAPVALTQPSVCQVLWSTAVTGELATLSQRLNNDFVSANIFSSSKLLIHIKSC